MKPEPRLEDLVGIEYTKLGFFREVQKKIAELRTSNLELEQKRQQLQAILDGIKDVMLVIGPDFRIISANNEYFRIFPEPRPEGKLCHTVLRGRNTPCDDCLALTASAKRKVCRRVDIITVAGTHRHFEITASPLQDLQGNTDQVLIFKRDVTVEKEYQVKYYQAEKIATIGTLAAGVAHEINNPLTAVSGFTQGLQRQLRKYRDELPDRLQKDFAEYTDVILKECHRCQEIVQSLLTFSRQTSGKFTPVALNEIIRETLRLLRYQLKGRDPDLVTLELDPDLPRVMGDESQMKQVVLNLIINALDAVKKKGTITMRTYVQEDDKVCLEVEDSGCGIPEAYLDKLFDPFFTTKPVGQGIGIGLSTCYNIISSHGGEISAASREGKGSRFHITLPLESS